MVYLFACSRDVNTTYIGETTRPLAVRVKEHLSLGKKLTAVGTHIKNCDGCKNHNFTLDNFEVLKRCPTAGATRINEALLIRRHSPLINKQLYLSGASFVLTVY